MFRSKERRLLTRLYAAAGNRVRALQALELLVVYLEHEGSVPRLYELSGEAMHDWLEK